MSMFTKDYWKTFSNYGNITNETLSESGPTAKKTNGDSYSEQDGNSVSVQNGNKNTLQVGVSNALTYGFSFSTLAGASFSTTGGAALSNHVGLKWGMFVGPEMSINSAATVKVTKGAAYTFDTVTKCETAAQKLKTARNETKAVTKLIRIIGDEMSTLRDFTQIVSETSSVSAYHYDLKAFIISWAASAVVDIKSMESVEVTAPQVSLRSTASLALESFGPATLNGSVIRVG